MSSSTTSRTTTRSSSSLSSASATSSTASTTSLTTPSVSQSTLIGGPPTQTSSTPLNSSGPSLQSSSSLYLYTFLATLVLLLGVSGAIVVRSFVLRRRHQALVEEAIRNGTWVPPPFGAGGRAGRHGLGRRELGEKPKMWEAWVGKDREVLRDRGGLDEEGEEKMSKWESILPISATYLNSPLSTNQSKTSPNSNSNSNSGSNSGSATPSRAHAIALFPWTRRHRHQQQQQQQNRTTTTLTPDSTTPDSTTPNGLASASVVDIPMTSVSPPMPGITTTPGGVVSVAVSASAGSSTPALSPTTTPSLSLTVDPSTQSSSSTSAPIPSTSSSRPQIQTPQTPTLRLTVLIAMPTAPSARKHLREEEEDGPPAVEFGILDVGVGVGSAGGTLGAGAGAGGDVGTSESASSETNDIPTGPEEGSSS